MNKSRSRKRIQKLLIATLAGFFLFWAGENLHSATAQTLRPESVAAQIYQFLPNLPKENQYISKETGEVNPDNTLVGRLVRYHQYVKSRPTRYRLDWKLTLADYLGINERIEEARYPGYTSLKTNPLEGDRAVITKMSRRQRNELVDAIVRIYNPESEQKPAANESTNSTTESPPTDSTPESSFPKPGDADLLNP